jgi:hypothetical protein
VHTAARHRRAFVAAISLVATASAAAQATAPTSGAAPAVLPFSPGERLVYSVKVALAGASGRGVMTVSGPEQLHGTDVYVLRSETTVGVGPIHGSDRSASWYDPARSTSLRYVQHERHIISSGDDSVEINPEARSWAAADGRSGTSPTESPLDVLSFIYYVRTLDFSVDSVMTLSRHFDADRSPTTIQLVGRDTIETKAGRFAILRVAMRVRDPRHYKGEGVLLISLSDDARRLPVRITSVMPIVGTTVMTLDSVTSPHLAAATAVTR